LKTSCYDRFNSKVRWTFYGALFGFIFPVFALFLRVSQHGWDQIILYFQSDPLIWIIISAPLFLGIFSYFAGRENYRLNLLQKNLELLVEQRTHELDMQRAAIVQSSKMAALGDMASGIAHEINNPLAIIKGIVHQTKKHIENGSIDLIKFKEDLLKVEITVNRIAKIITSLRMISRNSEEDPIEYIKISSLVESVRELNEERYKRHSIDLRVNCNIDISIECRPSQIAQLLINLLANAFDAVKILPERWVALDIIQNGDLVIISVTDSGKGISSEVEKKLMLPFFTTKDIGKGTGLSLSISKGIAEGHHGRLYYDSSSKNTRFVLELRIKQPES
jgi:C4-dicarboxylate-specific signal transduction histidine kinase